MATQQPAQPASAPYPVTFAVDYPDRDLDRLSTFFRILAIIPIAIVFALLTSPAAPGDDETKKNMAIATGGFVALPTLLMILFRQKYPKWWFDWNLAFVRFAARIEAYLLLLRDEYPSTDEEQAVHVEINYPDVKKDLNRWMPLVKWLLAIPHLIVLVFLGIAAIFCVIVAWFAILFTKRYPKGLFSFVVGVYRWELRVLGYALLLVTDKYPPFSLEP